MVYGDDDDYLKLGRIAHTAGAATRSSSSSTRHAGTPRQRRPRTRPRTSPADFPDDFWVQLQSDGTNVTGEYSTDGSHWTQVGRACAAAGERAGSACSPSATRRRPQRRWPRSTRSAHAARARRAARASTTSSTARPSTPTRWNASVRQNQNAAVSGGQLTITTEPGDIYTGDTTPPPNNFILQYASHAGDGLDDRDEAVRHDQRRVRPGRPDRLRRTATTTSSSTRSPTPAQTADQPHRAAVGGRRRAGRPAGQADPEVPAGTAPTSGCG